jgi:hypothetical protein
VVQTRRISYFLNIDNRFKHAVSFGGQIQFVKLEGGLPIEWYIREEGCCADFKAHNRILKMTTQKDHISFDTVWHSIEGFYTKLIKPKKYYAVPFQIEVQYEGYNLRSGPEVINQEVNLEQTEVPGYRTSGNIIAKLKKGSSGWVIASEIDDTGRLWYLVVMDSGLDFEEFMGIVDDYDNQTFNAIGWLSSRFIKVK